MKYITPSLIAFGVALAACATPPGEVSSAESVAPEPPTPVVEAAPATGPDMSLEAISPEPGAIEIGLAGNDPANIARYLMASGASVATLSPNGDHVAYRSTVTGVRQLWVMPATGGQAKQLTFGTGITFFRWLPDSSGLIFGADNDGDEQESYFQISADGTSEQIIFPAVAGGFRAFGDISGDAGTIAYASTERNGLDFDIYTANLSSGEATRLFDGTFGYFARAFSPDATQLIVTETVGEDSDNLYLLDTATGALTSISTPEVRANHGDGGFAWLPDGSGFYFASNIDREYAAIFAYDLETDSFDLVVETERDAESVRLCGPDGQYLAFTENVDGFDTLNVIDRIAGASISTPALAEGVYRLTCGGDTTRIAIGVNGWRTPGDVVVWDMATEEVFEPYTSNYAGLDPERLVRPESIRMTARDGVELQGLLYLPDESSLTGDGLPPVLFEVHGGPTAQSRPTYDAIVQYHVDRGIAVFEPNVRGSTGFGRTYTTLDDKENRRDSVRDLIDMAEALRADGRVDVDRAAVSGGSYGGYAVNAVLALYPDTFSVGISRYGVADWVTALQVASPGLKASDRIEYGDITEQKWIDYYTENSPIRLADQIQVPVLFSHGVMDPRIDIYETEVMVKALRANGIEAPYIRIPDEGHGWRKMSNRLFYYREQVAFLERQLGE